MRLFFISSSVSSTGAGLLRVALIGAGVGISTLYSFAINLLSVIFKLKCVFNASISASFDCPNLMRVCKL